MSGTSCDGLDIAYAEFYQDKTKWHYDVLLGETVVYKGELKEKLTGLSGLNTEDFVAADMMFGKFIGEEIRSFIKKHDLKPDLIGSHGHTVFHQPEAGFTRQIGHGGYISAVTLLPVVCDFRTQDIASGGQGAPLVPIGDRLLFSEYSFCLNLGGIANISGEKDSKTLAFDCCPANLILNYLAEKRGRPYDKGGDLARSGRVDEALLMKLDQTEYYTKPFPKSLSEEIIKAEFLPLIESQALLPETALATFTEHTAGKVAEAINQVSEVSEGKLLITGGGAFNTFLIERIGALLPSGTEAVVPDDLTVNYKEALIFAFMGLLRVKDKINCLSSVTGARRDSIAGALYGTVNFS